MLSKCDFYVVQVNINVVQTLSERCTYAIRTLYVRCTYAVRTPSKYHQTQCEVDLKPPERAFLVKKNLRSDTRKSRYYFHEDYYYISNISSKQCVF